KGPETDAPLAEHMQSRIDQGLGYQAEILGYSKTGRTHWVAIDAQPIHDSSGKLTNFIRIASDVTERKIAEQALHDSEKRFALAVRGSSAGIWDWNVLT